jgi:hypothetical protein
MVASTCQGSAAFAQADEAAYCKALADVYMQKVIQTDKPTGQVPWAISKCQVDPAESIGILQKALTDAKVPLPSRQ